MKGEYTSGSQVEAKYGEGYVRSNRGSADERTADQLASLMAVLKDAGIELNIEAYPGEDNPEITFWWKGVRQFSTKNHNLIMRKDDDAG